MEKFQGKNEALEQIESDYLCLDIMHLQTATGKGLIFSNDDLQSKFNELICEKYGDFLEKNWYFYQKDKNQIIRIPLLGECCFSLAFGDVVGIYKFLDQKEFNEALDMIFSVARDMGITTLVRKVESTSLKSDNESKYTYDYEIVIEGNSKPFKM